MPMSYASVVVDGNVDAVWSLVRDFNGLAGWLPAVDRSEIEEGRQADQVGVVRHLALKDGGGEIRERLVGLDDVERACTYEILESPFKVRRYRATIRVRPLTETGQSFVEWWSYYDCEAADEAELDKTFSRGVFGSGLAALKQRFG